MIHLPHNAALLIIDVQKGFDNPVWGQRNNPEAEMNIASLLQLWRQTGRPILHIQHLPRMLTRHCNPASPATISKKSLLPR